MASSGSILGESAPGKMEGVPREHVTQAIQVPQRQERPARDVFDDDDGSGVSEDEDEEEGEEDDDDGDFSEDEEEEEDVRSVEESRWRLLRLMIRTTSSAAGVEVVSRHKD
jgi:hypothetical protein